MELPTCIREYPRQEEAELVARDLYHEDFCLHSSHYRRGDIVHSISTGQLGRVVSVDPERVRESENDMYHIRSGGVVHYYLLWQRPTCHQVANANELILIESWARQESFVTSTIVRMDEWLDDNERRVQRTDDRDDPVVAARVVKRKWGKNSR